jgi:hypothetical protein
VSGVGQSVATARALAGFVLSLAEPAAARDDARRTLFLAANVKPAVLSLLAVR